MNRQKVFGRFGTKLLSRSALQITFFNIVINVTSTRWAGHVARMGEERGRIGFWWENRKERDPGET